MLQAIVCDVGNKWTMYAYNIYNSSYTIVLDAEHKSNI